MRLIIKESKRVRPIQVWVDQPDKRGPRNLYTLGLKWLGDRKFIEIRGSYEEGENSPFQQAIDSLTGPLVGGELMAGHMAIVTDRFYGKDYPTLVKILQDES